MSCSQGYPAFHDAEGKSVPVSEFKGKWIIVNYWATWCDICLDEIPELNRLYRNNHDKNILIYGVNYDQLSPVGLKNTVRKMKIRFPVLAEDPSQMWQLDEITNLPTTFIINPRGEVVKKIVGGPNTETSLLELVHALQSNTAQSM